MITTNRSEALRVQLQHEPMTYKMLEDFIPWTLG